MSKNIGGTNNNLASNNETGWFSRVTGRTRDTRNPSRNNSSENNLHNENNRSANRSENRETSRQDSRSYESLFGCNLNKIMELSNNLNRSRDRIPRLVKRCIEYLEDKGLEEVGIYRLSGSTRDINALRSKFDKDGDVDFYSEYTDVNAVASMFKAWVRELPECILTDHLLPSFLSLFSALPDSSTHFPDHLTLSTPHPLINNKTLLAQLSELIGQLPDVNRRITGAWLRHLSRISKKEDVNKMGLNNLMVVWSPTVRFGGALFIVLILHHHELFFAENSQKTKSGSSPISASSQSSLPPATPGKNKSQSVSEDPFGPAYKTKNISEPNPNSPNTVPPRSGASKLYRRESRDNIWSESSSNGSSREALAGSNSQQSSQRREYSPRSNNQSSSQQYRPKKTYAISSGPPAPTPLAASLAISSNPTPFKAGHQKSFSGTSSQSSASSQSAAKSIKPDNHNYEERRRGSSGSASSGAKKESGAPFISTRTISNDLDITPLYKPSNLSNRDVQVRPPTPVFKSPAESLVEIPDTSFNPFITTRSTESFVNDVLEKVIAPSSLLGVRKISLPAVGAGSPLPDFSMFEYNDPDEE